MVDFPWPALPTIVTIFIYFLELIKRCGRSSASLNSISPLVSFNLHRVFTLKLLFELKLITLKFFCYITVVVCYFPLFRQVFFLLLVFFGYFIFSYQINNFLVFKQNSRYSKIFDLLRNI